MKIYRYEIPVDDQWHTILLRGNVLHVASRQADVVELWAGHADGFAEVSREFRAVGTGQTWPPELSQRQAQRWVGTVISPDGSLVWHLLERFELDAWEGPE